MNPRQALLDALTAERFTYVPTPVPAVSARQARHNRAVMLREIEDNDRYDRQLRLIEGLGA